MFNHQSDKTQCGLHFLILDGIKKLLIAALRRREQRWLTRWPAPEFTQDGSHDPVHGKAVCSAWPRSTSCSGVKLTDVSLVSGGGSSLFPSHPLLCSWTMQECKMWAEVRVTGGRFKSHLTRLRLLLVGDILLVLLLSRHLLHAWLWLLYSTFFYTVTCLLQLWV